jgi:hypothetical protein
MIKHVRNMPATFTVGDLPVKIERRMLFFMLGIVPLFMAWLARRRRPERTWMEAIAAGWLYFLVLLTADTVHITGHAISARKAGAPMDAVYVPVGMPRTIYFDNDVPPDVHIKRSLGGPIASMLALAISVALFVLAPARTLFRELAELAVLGHGFIGLGSWLPIPGVDGAILLHWWRRMRQDQASSS